MMPQPVDRPQAFQQGLPSQCVREAEPPGPVGQLVEELCPHRLVQQPEDPFRLGTAGAAHELRREAAAHQRCQLQRPPRGNAQAGSRRCSTSRTPGGRPSGWSELSAT
jgi:hypothetical protein